MMIQIINKILILITFMSSLNIIRHIFFITQSMIKKIKYKLTDKELRLLTFSLGLVLTIITTGLIK